CAFVADPLPTQAHKLHAKLREQVLEEILFFAGQIPLRLLAKHSEHIDRLLGSIEVDLSLARSWMFDHAEVDESRRRNSHEELTEEAFFSFSVLRSIVEMDCPLGRSCRRWLFRWFRLGDTRDFTPGVFPEGSIRIEGSSVAYFKSAITLSGHENLTRLIKK